MKDFFRLKKQAPITIEKTKSIMDIRYAVIDTELTGLNEKKDSILSMGAVRMTGTRIEIGETFHKLIKPETKFKADSVVVHGITPSDVSMEPNVDAILAEFLRFCDGDVIVGHCVSIDLEFINREMKRMYNDTMHNPVIDTYMIFDWPRQKVSSRACFSAPPRDCGLYEIAKCFGIAVRGAHDALMDSFITAQLFQRFIPVLIEVGIKEIGDLLTIGHPLKGGDVFKTSREVSNF
jgi:DNA polymerase-3 subunit epsilon